MRRKRFVSIKTKIIFFTVVTLIVGFAFIYTVIFATMFNSFREAAKVEFLQVGQKYSMSFERKVNNAMNYLAIVASTLEIYVRSGETDRETLQKMAWQVFDSYQLIDGSSIYFEPNMYDGRDADYVGSNFGTAKSGRICYYFYRDKQQTAYLPEALPDEIEFDLPHYTEAKRLNRPIYTEPTGYEVDGRWIPMFTLTYPVRDKNKAFIGAVTVDLFLNDIYAQLRNENIYETGYVIISNGHGEVIYSPRFEDIGKNRIEVGVDYALPLGSGSAYDEAVSIINGKNCFVSTTAVYIPQLASSFYISVAAPLSEVNASGLRLIGLLLTFGWVMVILIALLLYYRIGKISAPIKELTNSANNIANGNQEEATAFLAVTDHAKTLDEMDILFAAIKKMLLQLNEVQDLKVEALTLKHKKEKAEAQAQAKNDFLAKMSHEIRTPMNAVMGMSELILRKELPADVYENALGIKNASINLLAIINDILDFSKIESGKMEIVETGYWFPSLINDAISIIRVRLLDRPVQFTVDVDPTLPAALVGDEVRVRQMLINLLSNAVKYTHKGHIALNITGEIKGGTVVLQIAVSDSGVGIKDEDIGKLFGDFVQIDTAKNKGIEGTGLGLAIVRNLSRAMGGDVSVTSEYGVGSTFILTLPQKFVAYEPFAAVEEPENKAVLIYETRPLYRDSLLRSFDSLKLPYMCADNISMLFNDLNHYPYVFISSFMYGSINPALKQLEQPPHLVILADITEAMAPRDARVLALPAHPLSIANILNDREEQYSNILMSGAGFTAPQAKVLVVDDITANLKVAEGLLAPYEMQVTCCHSSREALHLVQVNHYDLVFMDHMMPEMDGIEATVCIRAMEGDYYHNLPIVALTANAVSGIREMFVENGMDDFLAKPIETAKLNTILERWIPRDLQHKTKVKQEIAPETEFIGRLRTARELNVDKALSMLGYQMQTYENILRLSLRLMPDNMERLTGMLQGGNIAAYAIEVHGLKGVLNNIGAYDLGLEAFALEKLAKAGDAESCEERHDGFMARLTQFHITVSALDDDQAVAKERGDLRLLEAVCPRLADALEYYDSTLALEIIADVDKYTYSELIDGLLRELTRAFEAFDFERAAALLEQLKGGLAAND